MTIQTPVYLGRQCFGQSSNHQDFPPEAHPCIDRVTHNHRWQTTQSRCVTWDYEWNLVHKLSVTCITRRRTRQIVHVSPAFHASILTDFVRITQQCLRWDNNNDGSIWKQFDHSRNAWLWQTERRTDRRTEGQSDKTELPLHILHFAIESCGLDKRSCPRNMELLKSNWGGGWP